MFEGTYKLNHVSATMIGSFGISPERYTAIMRKLTAVANIYPDYIILTEVWMNALDFNDFEKAFGLFQLGKMFGMGVLMKRLKITTKYPSEDMEGKLLKRLYEGKKDIHRTAQDLLRGRGN